MLAVLLEVSGYELYGTNIFQFYFTEAKDQELVNFMQQIVRAVEDSAFASQSDFIIHQSKLTPHYTWEPYTYIDVSKNTKFNNNRLIDRTLIAFDDLCCISEFFRFSISIDDYLKEAQYILFYFCKMIAIVLDETFDNVNSYIMRVPDDNNSEILLGIINGIDKDTITLCKKLRNNLHYGFQEAIPEIRNQELYELLKSELSIVDLIIQRTRIALNIYPSKSRLVWYRFLRWLQMPR